MNLIETLANKKTDLELAAVMVAAFVLRFVNLGYSDFQGDEVKALFIVDNPNGAFQFLLDQRKGPFQFLVTYLVRYVDPNYANQFLVRLPFTIAALLSVYFFYKLIQFHFGTKIAGYSSMLLATNGIFVALSRIAQYQSFVILFSVLCLYTLSIAAYRPRMRVTGIYLSMLLWAMAFLSHYDAIFILPPAMMLLAIWVRQADLAVQAKAKTLILAFALLAVLALAFYIPWALHISQATKEYWSGRLVGGGAAGASSSYYMFTFYQPIYVIHAYTLCGALAALALIIGLSPRSARASLKKVAIGRTLAPQASALIRAEIGTGRSVGLLLWFAFPFSLLELVVYEPGTHIYTYLLPAFVLVGIGICYMEKLWLAFAARAKAIKPMLISGTILAVFFAFLFLQSYAMFVDNHKEYPWQTKSFLMWTFPAPSSIYQQRIFGFPYFREWESIAKFVKSRPEVRGYASNEKASIASFYLPVEMNSEKAGVYVYIHRPQSFYNEIEDEKAKYWVGKYSPVYTASRNGTDLADIYLMPKGTLEELRARGY